MIQELTNLIQNFPGEASRTRCFGHIVNLTAKTLLLPFDAPKGKVEETMDRAERELRELAEGADVEDLMTRVEMSITDDDDEDDNADGWVDERAEMSEDEQEDLDESVRPMRMVFVRVDFFRKQLDSL
jgi:hypothetical protein